MRWRFGLGWTRQQALRQGCPAHELVHQISTRSSLKVALDLPAEHRWLHNMRRVPLSLVYALLDAVQYGRRFLVQEAHSSVGQACTFSLKQQRTIPCVRV